jgi:hypothetical protein
LLLLLGGGAAYAYSDGSIDGTTGGTTGGGGSVSMPLQDVTSNRSPGTDYLNDNSEPLLVVVQSSSDTSGTEIELFLQDSDGNFVESDSRSAGASVDWQGSFVVPPNTGYRIRLRYSGQSVNGWYEAQL